MHNRLFIPHKKVTTYIFYKVGAINPNPVQGVIEASRKQLDLSVIRVINKKFALGPEKYIAIIHL